MVIQVCVLTSNTEEAEVEWFYEDLQDLLELTPKKDVLFILGDWDAKVGSQETPEVTGKLGLGVQNEAGQRLIEFYQESALVIANTLFQQHNRRLYTWTSSDGQHRNHTDYIICSQRWRSFIQSAKTRLGADCSSGHELLTVKFRFKWKKVGKSTRPFRYAALLLLLLLSHLSRVRLCVTPYTAAYQAPLSMRCSRQEYWNEFPCPPPGDLPTHICCVSCFAGDSLPAEPPGKPKSQTQLKQLSSSSNRSRRY